MRKRLFGVVLTLCLLLSLLPFGAAASAFSDVPADAYYADSVTWAVENGVTKGTSETTFSPNATCTRAQVVSFLWRAAGEPAPETAASPFADVRVDSYYGKAVLWAVERKITAGTSKTTFSPDAGCTRGQVVTFLHRAAGEPAAAATDQFSDVAKDAYFALPVAWALKNEITSGTSATTFSPNATCTRGQIVTFLYRQVQMDEIFSISKITITKADGTVTTEEYQYDENGNNVLYSHHGGIVQKRTYDASGLPVEQTWSAGEDVRTTRYEHDAAGNLIRETSAWNYAPSTASVTTYTYDDARRVIGSVIVYGDRTIESTFTYDEDGFLVSQFEKTTYSGSDNVDEITNTCAYDEHGSMTKNVIVWNSDSYDSEYTSVYEYIYTYDEDGSITSCTEWYNGEKVQTTTWASTYLEDEKMTQETVTETDADGETSTTICLYDARGCLVRETFLNSEGKTTLTREYEYISLRVSLLPQFWQGVIAEEIYA